MIRKIKELILDPSRQESSTRIPPQRGIPRSRRGENQRRGNRRQTLDVNQTKTAVQRKNYLTEGLILGFLFVVALFVLFGNNRSNTIAIDPESLCPINNEHIVRKTYILIDLSEALRKDQRSNLKKLLEKTAENMETRELLSISQMQTLQNNPRKEVQRFCSPDISRIGQAGTRIKTDNCDEVVDDEGYAWPRNIGDAEREDIHTACGHYLERKEKVKDAADLFGDDNKEQQQSYIVRSIEDTMVDASDEPSNVPSRLIVFSDMLQNAAWFSQYRTRHGEWTIENLRKRRKNAPGMEAQPDNNFNEVLLCYLPSVDSTVLATSRHEKQHRQMWEDYFSENSNVNSTSASGCAVAIEDMARKN